MLRSDSAAAPSTSPADTARGLEIEFISKGHLVESYAALHSCRARDEALGGYTEGFPSNPLVNSPDPPPGGDTQFSPTRAIIQETDRRRPIDRILTPPGGSTDGKDFFYRSGKVHSPFPHHHHMDESYPTFLAYSDHKAVILAFGPRPFSLKNERSLCPTTLLADYVVTNEVRDSISELSCEGLDWWQRAPSIIRTAALDFTSVPTIPVTLRLVQPSCPLRPTSCARMDGNC